MNEQSSKFRKSCVWCASALVALIPLIVFLIWWFFFR